MIAYLIIRPTEEVTLKEFQITNTKQILKDWKKPFISDIKVIYDASNNTKCSDVVPESEDLYTYVWQGLKRMWIATSFPETYNTYKNTPM